MIETIFKKARIKDSPTNRKRALILISEIIGKSTGDYESISHIILQWMDDPHLAHELISQLRTKWHIEKKNNI